MSETPITDRVEAEFLGGRSLTWLEVASKSGKVFKEMRDLERDLRAAQEALREAQKKLQEARRVVYDIYISQPSARRPGGEGERG